MEDLAFAKIVSVPKPGSAWSQAYNAGRLFTVLSLEKNAINPENPDELNIVGKDLLAKLEEEFFTLDFKNLESIKQAISNAFEDIPDDINYSFAAAFFAKGILHLFTIRNGAVFIKRESKLARSSLPKDESSKHIECSFGHLANNDLIILTTAPLPDIITEENLASLDSPTPNEIAENLAPKIQEKDDGKTAAIIIKYTDSKPQEHPQVIKGEPKEKKPKNYAALLKNYLPIKNLRFIQLNHPSKVMLTITFIILTILTSSVYFGLKKQENSKIRALFEKTYPQAEKKYNEGNSLLNLNKNLANQNFLESQKILEESIGKFAKNPKQQKQIGELLKKVNEAIASSSGINFVKGKLVDSKESLILFFELQKPNANQFTQDEKNIYFLDSNAVYSVVKEEEKAKEIIKNENLWQDAGGIGVFLGNIYVLDKKQKQILKFVPTENDYIRTNYLTKDLAPDFSKATSIAIDGSIYVLLSDGSIEKFIRGKEDHFTVSGLDKPFSNPSRIFTDANTSSIYILDNGNSRIVVLNKEGVYQNQYQTNILKSAKDFEVLESSKKIYVLSQNKIYEMELKQF